MIKAKSTVSYHGASKEVLNLLNTRHLVALMNGARSIRTCECCGEEQPGDRPFNDAQRELRATVKEILLHRPHVPRSSKQTAPQQKRILQY